MDQLAIFAKYWQPGRVKTRLAEAIGHQAAAEVYLSLLQHSLARFAQTGDRRTIVYWPPDRHREFESLASGNWRTTVQQGSDLGERMSHFFRAIFANLASPFANLASPGKDHVVVIGSDSPTLPNSILDQAFDALQKKEVVIGPSDDGGYYLIGMRADVTSLFEGIDWSTEHVFAQTMQRIESAGVTYHRLPSFSDIDDIGDLNRLLHQLSQTNDVGDENRPLRESILSILTRHQQTGVLS